MKDLEIGEEQKYFDACDDAREQHRRDLKDAHRQAAHPRQAAAIKADVDRMLARLGEPGSQVANIRYDLDGAEAVYVGRHLIHSEDQEPLVLNWQSPAATVLAKASPAEPGDVVRKATYSCANGANVIETITPLLLREIAESVRELGADAPSFDDALLTDLGRGRTGEMHDIVATIQATQMDVISAPMDRVLVVQGGPGTGKTAVALHRVSWLLFNHSDSLQPADVLVVGPNPTFVRYIRRVLPGLGDRDVQQKEVRSVADRPAGSIDREEHADVTRVKGEERMVRLLRNALWSRVGLPPGEDAFRMGVGGQQIVIYPEDLEPMLDPDRFANYQAGRLGLRNALIQMAESQVSDARRLGTGSIRTPVDLLAERVWPQYTPAAFLQELLASRDRLLASAGDDFTAREVQSLQRRAAENLGSESWSEADLPLLDELSELISGRPETSFRHVVVDEAQDLSPMQLRMIARRSATGSMTLVGDIAQSTGPWAREDWVDVLEHLPKEQPHVLEELEYGYRVPRQVFDLARRLLPLAAPGVRPPRVVREGPEEPFLLHQDAESVCEAAVDRVRHHAGAGRFVGVICPDVLREDLEASLKRAKVNWGDADAGELSSSINVMKPVDAKGLEFDSVIVLEPAEIVAESDRGHRMLYIALTRATQYLDVVHSGDVLPGVDSQTPMSEVTGPLPPDPFGSVTRTSGTAPASPTGTHPAPPVKDAPIAGRSALVTAVADQLAAEIRANLLPESWDQVLEALAEALRQEP